jgi:hypothetical protein
MINDKWWISIDFNFRIEILSFMSKAEYLAFNSQAASNDVSGGMSQPL